MFFSLDFIANLWYIGRVMTTKTEENTMKKIYEYITKKGKKIAQSVEIPMGRKIRQSILQEKRRLAKKAALEARR